MSRDLPGTGSKTGACGVSGRLESLGFDRSHTPRGKTVNDALRQPGRRASSKAFPRGAWERSYFVCAAILVGDVRGYEGSECAQSATSAVNDTLHSSASLVPPALGEPRGYTQIALRVDRSHAPRGNAATDALRQPRRRASEQTFPRGAWERSTIIKAEQFGR